MSVPIVDTIVLTWNRLDLIRPFVESYRACTVLPTRLIIIDNASNDGTAEYLASLRSSPDCEIKVITNQENLGFVSGMNQGIKESRAQFVCLANNDLIFSLGWLDELVNVFEANKQIGLLNPNSNNLGERLPAGELIEQFGQEIHKKYRGTFVEMPFCIGFCLAIRREVIERIGGFSEEFQPFFFEDTDYSLRAQKSGFLIGVAKGAYVWHKEHASFDRIKKQAEERFTENKKIFEKKWGKTLRIAAVVESPVGLPDTLGQAVQACRQGNFVRLFYRGALPDRAIIFKDNHLIDHSGVIFESFASLPGLLWNILKKKKKYNLVITGNRSISRFLKMFFYLVATGFDPEIIMRLKKGE